MLCVLCHKTYAMCAMLCHVTYTRTPSTLLFHTPPHATLQRTPPLPRSTTTTGASLPLPTLTATWPARVSIVHDLEIYVGRP